MALTIDVHLTPRDLVPALNRVFELSAEKITALHKTWKPERGAPVFTVGGQYTTRGWTEWTAGFQHGSALLQYDATGEERFLEMGRSATIGQMSTQLSNMGVHDHGFNILSTYGNLWRLMKEREIGRNPRELQIHELALKVSGAVQAARWTALAGGGGFIYSFNGPHSLFIDTVRSLRSLAMAHALGQALMGENGQRICLLQRLVEHAAATARYAVFYGEGRDHYDVRGRVAQESLFNVNNSSYRCPSTQQGYSPFTTWTRGLAWGICGFAEQLEFLETVTDADLEPLGGRKEVVAMFLKAATAMADYYIANTPVCGVPYWDTGAPQLHRLGDYLEHPADPFNPWEPVDSSAAVVAAQGLLRLGNHLNRTVRSGAGRRHRQAGLSVARTLFAEPYLSVQRRHQGLLLHSVYHRPNGWDRRATGQSVPNGESSMWGDYHARELALMLMREADGEPPLFFFGSLGK
jgi:hypothetical protein